MTSTDRKCCVCGKSQINAKGMCGVCYTRKKSLDAGVHPSPTRDMSIAEKLAYKSTKTKSGCIEYTGRKDKDGYGLVCYNGRSLRAHRVSYELSKGPVPKDLKVMHTCDNPSCINPDHLIVGTTADNQKDKVNKGRQAHGTSHGRCKLTAEIVERIKVDMRELRFIASDYGVSMTQVSRIRRGILWVK